MHGELGRGSGVVVIHNRVVIVDDRVVIIHDRVVIITGGVVVICRGAVIIIRAAGVVVVTHRGTLSTACESKNQEEGEDLNCSAHREPLKN